MTDIPLCYRSFPIDTDKVPAFVQQIDGSFVGMEDATAEQLLEAINMEMAAATWHISRREQLQVVFGDRFPEAPR